MESCVSQDGAGKAKCKVRREPGTSSMDVLCTKVSRVSISVILVFDNEDCVLFNTSNSSSTRFCNNKNKLEENKAL